MIHKAGWAHRDLSVGNLYLYIDPVSGEKRGLIEDFEFSKKVGSGGRHDFKIVCLLFLVEIWLTYSVRALLISYLPRLML